MQNRSDILHQALSYISQSISGLEIENAKVDFKSVWYDLSTPKGINEFLKDSTAIANSFGPDGMIIIGYDEKKRELSNTKFSDCGLKDSSQLPSLVAKRVDRMFQFDFYEGEIMGFNLGIIHLPPSFDKPHVLRNYQTFEKLTNTIKSNEDHKIFVRRGSSTYPASKADLELMFYDRKNIKPDYEILSTIPITSLMLTLTGVMDGTWFLDTKLNVILENIGRRPVSISSISMTMSLFDDPSVHEKMEFITVKDYLANPVILQSGEMLNARFALTTERLTDKKFLEYFSDDYHKNKKHMKVLAYSIMLTSGTSLSLKPVIV